MPEPSPIEPSFPIAPSLVISDLGQIPSVQLPGLLVAFPLSFIISLEPLVRDSMVMFPSINEP